MDTAQSSIQGFFAGRSIFITGATGYMGKVLVEKLLRSCPDVKEIFLLMRPKRGMGIDDRLKNLLTNKLFDKLRNERPSSFEKLVPVAGDISVEGLALMPADRQMLIDRVSVIFHSGANVRFDESLKNMIFANIRSTRDMCVLASSMKNLTVFVHVSTAYCQIDKHVVDEILYPTDIDWRRVIEVAESVDEYILKILTMKYIRAMPNTYVFSKMLAEQVISDYSELLPCVIVRPTVIISMMDEDPIKGWIDNFNGPIGSWLGGAMGILHVFYCNPNTRGDYIPVDWAIKSLIITAWKRGIKTISEDKTVHVYNCSANNIKQMTIEEIQKLGFEIFQEFPPDRMIWSPTVTFTNRRWLYYILMMLLHFLPSIFVDGVLKLSRAKPMLLKLQRRVYVTNSALSHFLLNEWVFKNSKFLDLFEMLSAENKNFRINYNLYDNDIREYCKNAVIGVKVYLLNDDMNNLAAAKRKRNRLDFLHNIIKTILITFILWILYRKNILSNIVNAIAYIFYINV
ncbi:fatty acyl-CoA reductase 1-like isoform X1 [Odontomachus brunneus]|uniref:fatty acyl-CoA reductase 1-like isoform X1 n=1 Tax=Odontomachus brunneus TaxID=486640 RepID=UPI0013F1DDA4|nr:fatty acyl-CoA reductase 1-like isoform X1 [Odontomachus brunneus]